MLTKCLDKRPAPSSLFFARGEEPQHNGERGGNGT